MGVNSIDKKKEKELIRKKRKNFIKKIKRYFINITNKFKNIDKTNKSIIVVWSIILVTIILMATFLSVNNESRKKYYKMEKAMTDAVLDYVNTENIYPVKDSKAYIPLESLKLGNYIYKSDIVDSSCKGYSVVYYDDTDEKYVVESYISCADYTSKYYNDYKE